MVKVVGIVVLSALFLGERDLFTVRCNPACSPPLFSICVGNAILIADVKEYSMTFVVHSGWWLAARWRCWGSLCTHTQAWKGSRGGQRPCM